MVFILKIPLVKYFRFLPLCLLLGTAAPAQAQNPLFDILKGQPPAEVPASRLDLASEIPRKKEQNLKALAQEGQELEAKGGFPEIDVGSRGERRLELREELNGFYEQILEILENQGDLEVSRRRIEESREAWKGNKNREAKPSFFQLDDLSSERLLETGRIENAERNIETSKVSLEDAKALFEKRESERRQAKERLELNKDPAEQEALKLGLEIAELQSQLAEAKIYFFQALLKNLKLEKQNGELKRDLLSEKIQWFQDKVRFSEEHLQDKYRQIEQERSRLNRSLEALRGQLEAMKKAAMTPESALATPAPLEAGLDAVELEVQKLARLNLQSAIQITTFRLQRLKEIEWLWSHRFQIFNGKADKDQIAVWAEEAKHVFDRIRGSESQAYVRLSDLRKNLNNIQERIQNILPGEEETKKLLYAQKDLTQKILLTTQDSLGYLARDRQIFEKFWGEIKPKAERRGFKERLGYVWGKIQYVWNFELTSIDDKPITVKKLVLALILLLFGLKFARRLSLILGRKLFPKMGFETGVSAGLQTLAFYLLLFFVTILVLYIVNVPLTLFTVLGGALAIGVGFGSQNIVKNFISGLILLMERPIRVGDMVQMDDQSGVVERIGARSTMLRSFSNVNILIPNSDFLEKRVINWTLSDDLVRINVGVGVAYDSTPKDVAQLMMKAVGEHPKALKTPEPVVLFTDFGDNALRLEIYFWIRMASMMDRKKVESDVRFRIEEVFREAGIVIAYQQRDIHLQTKRPLEVQILK